MRIDTSTLYCDKCGKEIREGMFINDHVNVYASFKSIMYDILTKKITLCKPCAKEYFEAVKPFYPKNNIEDGEQNDLDT